MRDTIRHIFRGMMNPSAGGRPATGIDARAQFNPDARGDSSIACNLNAAFLIALGGRGSPGYERAAAYLRDSAKHQAWAACADFFSRGEGLVIDEMEDCAARDPGFGRELTRLAGHLKDGARVGDDAAALWRVFFPEGMAERHAVDQVEEIRRRRTVALTGLNPAPIRDPAREVLFTANALVTAPGAGEMDGLDLDAADRDALAGMEGAQEYWYDHPVSVGAPPERNEILYGLRNLAEAVAFEKRRGGADAGARASCLLSVSATHRGLGPVARRWIARELSRARVPEGIDCYLATEDDAARILDEVLLPAAHRWRGAEGEELREVFGVDGEYGRHYSFLKAAAPLWRLFIDRNIRATFKTDLDQAFPQEELVRATGASAFGHLRSPLWGARGRDALGSDVRLGMIAGLLVNRADIGASLFAPDVIPPAARPVADETVFRSPAPQALSTAAEMGTRCGPGMPLDGVTAALQRVHVTGGTTGILLDDLVRYRPFTPSFIGRAEDQAYLMSVLFRPTEGAFLRYAHAHGLVMRHDADLFAEAARGARHGKILGDCARVLLFTAYARALPWGTDRVKDELDPFTGCFISRIPITIAHLRFALRSALIFASGNGDEGAGFVRAGVSRLAGPLEWCRSGLSGAYEAERRGWDLYYDTLGEIERRVAAGDAHACGLAERARGMLLGMALRSG